jgi:hypothetical protein
MTRSIASETLLRIGCFVVVCATLSTCSDATRPDPGGSGDSTLAEKIRDGVVVSGPLVSRDLSRSSGTTSDSALVYVSMPPGTLPAGDSVRVSDTRFGVSSRITAMGAGGFDPVSLYARADDSLDISVYTHGDATVARVRVGVLRQPSVVRTTPARGRTDVPLNQQIVIVLSQPIDASTVTPSSIELTAGGAPVDATVALQPGQPWVVLLSPVGLLTPVTAYQIVVHNTVTDVNGLALKATVTADFTTGSTVADVALVTVSTRESRYQSSDSIALASVGGTVALISHSLSARGDTLSSLGGFPYVWSSSDSAVATVSPSSALATVTAVAHGQALVAACVGSVCGHATIVVDALEEGLTPISLGNLPGSGWSRVEFMAGDYVVGNALVEDPDIGLVFHAFIWSNARGMEALPAAPDGSQIFPLEVNTTGTVLGESQDSLSRSEGWTWQRGSGFRLLPKPDTTHKSWYAFAINENGEVALEDTTPTLALWSESGGFRVFALPAGTGATGGFNDQQQLPLASLSTLPCDVTTLNCPTGTVAYVWDAHTGSVLHTLAPHDSLSGQALAIAPWSINNAGMVNGSVMKNEPSAESWGILQRAFRWTPSGGFSYFPNAEPGVGSEGVRMNQAGDMTVYLFSWKHVGQDSVYIISSAVWMANGTVVNLGSLGGVRTAANGINDAHMVAGHSQVGSITGPQQAVVWDLSTPATSPARSASSQSSGGQWQRAARRSPATLASKQATNIGSDALAHRAWPRRAAP